MSATGQLRTVQALRAIAALLVMMSHLRVIEAHQSNENFLLSEVWINGASGVDLFFVISGFIMVWVSGEKPPGKRAVQQFALARVVRIYPLWWLFAGLMVLYFCLSYGVPWDAAQLEANQLNGPAYLIKSALLIPQDWFPVLNIGWTLIHEMYFYLVFALILFLPIKRRFPALVIWGGLVCLGAVMGLSEPHQAKTLLQIAAHPMGLEFLMGCGVAYLVRSNMRFAALPALLVGIVVFAVALVVFPGFAGDQNNLAWYRTLCFGSASALIVYGLVCLELERGWGRKTPDILVKLGDWSYALYLSHILVLSAVARIWFGMFSAPGKLDNIAFVIVAIAMTICVSALTYALYERPIIRFVRKRMGNGRKSDPSPHKV